MLAARHAVAHARTCTRRSLSSSSSAFGGFAPFDVVNPATGDVIATIQSDAEPDVLEKLCAAKACFAAQRDWAHSTLEERQGVLSRFGKLLLGEEESLAAQLTSEMGKPLAQARGEIRGTASRLRVLSGFAAEALTPRTAREMGKLTERVEFEPLGVVANISAWNYPYFIASNVFAAAILTGNAVLYKPSEHAPLSGAAIGRLLAQAGLPPGVFTVVQGKAPTGAFLASLPRLGSVCFTGSMPTGRAIARAAAPFTRLNLELGGKDAAYVRHDVADIEAVASTIAAGAFTNAGQSCCSVERIYVHAVIAEQFTEALVECARKYVVGDPTDPGTHVGPLVGKQAVEHVTRQVSDAEAKGARVLFRGRVPDGGRGFFFPPTVVAGADHSMELMRVETFGPVAPVQIVRSDDEAIQLMEDSEYGLTAAVFSSSEEAALSILRALPIGTGYWNACDKMSPHVPWSGRKGSGMGCTLGLEGLNAFLQPKALHLMRPAGVRHNSTSAP